MYANGVLTPSTVINRKFDNLGRLWQILNNANQVTHEYNYDSQGNIDLAIASPNDNPANNQTTDYNRYDDPGNTRIKGYDALNRLIHLTDAKMGVTYYDYDGQDHLDTVKDPRNNTTSYTINGLGNLTQEDSPDRGITNNTVFDFAGNLKTSTDARGNTVNYTYDGLNRLLSATYTDAVLNYGYDSGIGAAGQLTHVDDPSGTTGWSYDSEGRLQSKTQTANTTNADDIPGTLPRIIKYSYDTGTGRLDTLTYPSGIVIKYGYDSAGRPGSLSYAAKDSVDFTTLLDNIAYQPLGPANSYRLAAVAGTPTISRHIDSDGHIDSYTLNDAIKTLDYDRLGNLKTLGDAGTTANGQAYLYDPLNRLTDFWAPNPVPNGTTHTYQYDANGNRTQKTIGTASTTYVPEASSNRLDTVGTTPYNYDDSGNLASNGATYTFGYDGRNRLTQMQKTVNGISTDYLYGINALGQRVSKTSKAISTGGRVYVYDEAGHLIGEYGNNGVRIQEHLWLGDQPVAVINASGAGTLFYVLSDHLNTPRQIIDASNKLRWRWDNLDPFGANAPKNKPASNLAALTYNLRFPGQYADSETGLFYNYFRVYDPKGGRYTQSDPIGLAGGLNTYGYVNGNPVNWIDPTGEFAQAGLAPLCIANPVACALIGAGGAMLATPAGQDALKSAGKAIADLCKSDDDSDNCDTPLSKNEIERLKKYLGGSEALHKEKEGFGGPPKYFDFYKCRNGDIVIKRKGGGAIVSYTGLNVNNIL